MGDARMEHERELRFAQKLLDNFFLPMSLLCAGEGEAERIPSLEMRRLLQPGISVREVYAQLAPLCKPGVIYRYQDELDCNLLCFQAAGGDAPVIAVVGPYLLQPVTDALLRANAAKFPQPERILPSLEKYYREVPHLENENRLLVLLYTLGGELWGGGVTVEEIANPLQSQPLQPQGLARSAHGVSSLSIEALANRYADEEKLMRAVSAGQADTAAVVYNRFSARQMEQRTAAPLRGMKNYFIVLNTLLRKATEYGQVPPVYIDGLSSELARQIEAAPSTEALRALGPRMVRHYCQIVQEFSREGHSQLIRKLLMLVEADLMSDLGLSALARALNVNSSYLSSLFKKEMGMTLTEYVGRRRINHAKLLLETTGLQIQAIAQQCGIPDVNYFTRTFKKYAGLTPKEYRTAQRAG